MSSNVLYNLIISTLESPNLRLGKSVAVQTTGNDHQINKSLDKKLKMNIFGDSHSRDLAWKIKENLKEQVDIRQFVKPGAEFNVIVEQLEVIFRQVYCFNYGSQQCLQQQH